MPRDGAHKVCSARFGGIPSKRTAIYDGGKRGSSPQRTGVEGVLIDSHQVVHPLPSEIERVPDSEVEVIGRHVECPFHRHNMSSRPGANASILFGDTLQLGVANALGTSKLGTRCATRRASSRHNGRQSLKLAGLLHCDRQLHAPPAMSSIAN